jgi:ATP-dependent Clp protease protease subunit
MVPQSEDDAAHFVDVYTRLGKERTLLVSSYIDTHLSNLLTSSLLYLHKLDARAQIDVFMNCPGGDAHAVLAVVDVIRQIEPPIRTVNLGLTSGLAVLIAAAGTIGLRTATPHARFRLQCPSPSAAAPPAPPDDAAQKWLEQLSFCTGKPLSVVENDATSACYMDAREAVGYGICDHVLLPSTSAQLVARGRDQAKATFGHFAASKPLYHPDILKKKDG